MTPLPPISDELLMFIKCHIKENTASLRLKYHGKSSNFDLDFALTQIESRQKTKKKLLRFINNQCFIFPTTLSAEQASHEAVAAYHATLIEKNSELLDMTAGLGIDVMTMAQQCSHAIACELDEIKAQALQHNSEVLKLDNISIMSGDSTEWISKTDKHFDVIFIDPARRSEDNARTYNFHDCQPDIMKLQGLLSSKTSRLLIKASPLLDVAQTLKDISNVRAIRAICVNGECKEILVEALYTASAPSLSESVLKEAIDLKEDGTLISKFSFYDGSETEADSSTPAPVNCIPYALETDII
ncbi:MAG: RsmD family RNA methyltransferase, partial [Muribaculaceae bacterium]|nr:RsmD family RNA methyltransferase [Muribaculaceae bacterium]